MTTLHVGGVTVDREKALTHARHYLTDGSGWAYPSYDAYEADRAAGPLTDADFLAPLLLNVNQLKIRTYEALQQVRSRLDDVLTRIPVELDLIEASPQDLLLLGELFAVLDDPGVWGAQGTVLAKVLHRKRPAFVPLYDEQVRAVYQDGSSATVSRAPELGRPWGEFIVLFAAAVQADLRREQVFWKKIADLAPGPKITTLRALDIVAWWAGRSLAPDTTTNRSPGGSPAWTSARGRRRLSAGLTAPRPTPARDRAARGRSGCPLQVGMHEPRPSWSTNDRVGWSSAVAVRRGHGTLAW